MLYLVMIDKLNDSHTLIFYLLIRNKLNIKNLVLLFEYKQQLRLDLRLNFKLIQSLQFHLLL
jgi:hypothetical protein